MLANALSPEKSSGGHEYRGRMLRDHARVQSEAVAEAVAPYAPRAIPGIESRLHLAGVGPFAQGACGVQVE
jgi:hypothetical protein